MNLLETAKKRAVIERQLEIGRLEREFNTQFRNIFGYVPTYSIVGMSAKVEDKYVFGLRYGSHGPLTLFQKGHSEPIKDARHFIEIVEV